MQIEEDEEGDFGRRQDAFHFEAIDCNTRFKPKWDPAVENAEPCLYQPLLNKQSMLVSSRAAHAHDCAVIA